MAERATHQVLVGAGGGDAITEMARTLRAALRRSGPSEIYANFVAPEVAGDVRPLHELGGAGRDDVLVYHASFGEPTVTRVLLSRPERLVLVYHNITPAEHVLAHDPHFAAGLHWGRHELEILRDRVVLPVAVSAFNARELESIGYGSVQVVPAGLHPFRLHRHRPDLATAKRLADTFPNGFVLCVSQVLPHKRFETALQVAHLLRWVHELDLGLVIVGPRRMQGYQRALELLSRRLNLPNVWFAGGVSDEQLAAVFRLATVHLTTSAHEGLALPPLEAMSFGVPVVARAAGAIADTVGSGGIVLPASAGPALIAEAVAAVVRDPALRRRMRAAGRARACAVEREDPSRRFIELIDGVR